MIRNGKENFLGDKIPTYTQDVRCFNRSAQEYIQQRHNSPNLFPSSFLSVFDPCMDVYVCICAYICICICICVYLIFSKANTLKPTFSLVLVLEISIHFSLCGRWAVVVFTHSGGCERWWTHVTQGLSVVCTRAPMPRFLLCLNHNHSNGDNTSW